MGVLITYTTKILLGDGEVRTQNMTGMRRCSSERTAPLAKSNGLHGPKPDACLRVATGRALHTDVVWLSVTTGPGLWSPRAPRIVLNADAVVYHHVGRREALPGCVR